jgi:2-haloacid dehalogenase
VKALFFDVFGTVVDWRTSVIEECRRFGQEKGLAVDWEAFVDAWRSGYRPGMEAVRAGRMSWTNVDRIHRARLEELLRERAIAGLSEEDKLGLNRAWHHCAPWADAVPGLTRLRKKYVLSTLSNADVACLVVMAKRGGLPWDCVLSSEFFRHYKPDPEVYRGAIELLGLEPAETMMVAAHNYDLRAARSHGMATAFVPRPREYGERQTTDLRAEEAWDIVVGDFEELAAVMGA